MTFAEIIAEAMQDSFNVARYTDRMKRWANEAQGKFARQVDVPLFAGTAFNFDAVLGARYVALPSDFVRATEGVGGGSAVKIIRQAGAAISPISLRRRRREEFPVEWLRNPAVTLGQPTDYVVNAGFLLFTPACDMTYSMVLGYRRLPAELVEDGDVPEIPADYHELLVTYCRAKAFRAEDDRESHDAHKGDWEAGLAAARVDLQFEHEGPSVVRGMWG